MAHRILPLLALAVLALSCQCTGTPVRAFGTLQATPAELRFDGVVVGSTRALRLTVRNAGRATLTLTDFTLANDSRSAFSLDGAAAGALQGGAERELTVTYAARGRGNDLALAVTFKDLTTGGGVVEISGAPLALSASGSLTPALVAPFGWGGTAVGWGGPALVRGSAGYLFAYNDLTSGPIRARTLAATLQSPSAEVVLAGSYASSGSAELWSPELGFDGTNYLAVSADRAHQLPGQRLTASGGLLDSNTAPMLLTPSDGLLETNPSLGFDRAGRYLIAYRKPDGHTWVRLFSTCP